MREATPLSGAQAIQKLSELNNQSTLYVDNMPVVDIVAENDRIELVCEYPDEESDVNTGKDGSDQKVTKSTPPQGGTSTKTQIPQTKAAANG